MLAMRLKKAIMSSGLKSKHSTKNTKTAINPKRLINDPKTHVALVVLSYLFFTVFYMGPSVWKCNDTLYGFGDNTAGPVWKFGLEPTQAPLGSFENATNYPVGENLYSPTNYSLSGQSLMIWGSSKMLGPVCGYNSINIAGFVLSALVMFGFIYAITKNKWIAWLSGYAVSFSPYYQMKIGGHPGYGYQAFLIGSAWALYNLIKKRRSRDIIIFASVTAFCFYFDPYFSLLASSIVVPLVLVWFGLLITKKLHRSITNEYFVQNIKIASKAFAVTLILILPLVFVTLKNAKQISTSVAASRGNVLFEARACSNYPHEYLAPFVLHPVFERLYGSKTDYMKMIDAIHNGFSCGIGEDTIGLSLVIIFITGVGLIIIGWEKINKRKLGLGLGYDEDLVLCGMVVVLLAAVLLAIPPARVLGRFPTPAYLLLKVTPTWRTLTRLYVVVNFAVITLFSVAMLYFTKYFQKNKRLLVVMFLLVTLVVIIEYQAFKPFTGNSLSTFSYSKDVPAAYTWLGKQKDMSIVAEYPLEKAGGESNAMAYYLSMQIAHKKKLFNGNIPTSHEEEIKASLKDISDPQTVDVLGALGIDAVVIHGVDESIIRSISGLEVVYSAPQSAFNLLAFTPLVTHDNVVIAKIRKSKKSEMLVFQKGFVRNTNIIKSAVDWSYEAINNSEMIISLLPGNSTKQKLATPQCFKVEMAAAGDLANLTIFADGKIFDFGQLSSAYRPISIMAQNNIKLSNSTGHNMRVSDLGCEE